MPSFMHTVPSIRLMALETRDFMSRRLPSTCKPVYQSLLT